MRRILIALVFLALMSIPPIVRTVADLNTVGTGPTDVDIVPLLTIVDPSTIPKSDAVTSMPAGVASTVADLNTVGTGPTDVDIVPLLTIVDPSTIPKSDAVTSMPAGVASTYNIYPTTTSVNILYPYRYMVRHAHGRSLSSSSGWGLPLL